ncbi:hypothetical protein ACHAXS_000446 [Conticribra weissflogii]
MNGPFTDEYWQVAENEIGTLEDMGVWHVVEYNDDMNAISPWQCEEVPCLLWCL